MPDREHTEGYQVQMNPMTGDFLFTKGDRLVQWREIDNVPSDAPGVLHYKPGRIQRIEQELQES